MAARVRSESAQRVSGCVTALLREQPFFGSLALRLPVRADAGRETLASDGREIRYSPQWIAETDAHVIETAIARVVLACALKHHTRRGERDHDRWQRASQLVTHAVQDAAEYAPDELPEEIVVKGRGGTDFRPGFEWLDEQGIRPGVCLYFTDMECSRYPDAEPPFDVLWVNYSSPPEDWNREPWGERIDIAA